jgi:hypothetical protein
MCLRHLIVVNNFFLGAQAENMLEAKTKGEKESHTKELSDYEKLRLQKIERNEKKLASVHTEVHSHQLIFSLLTMDNDSLGQLGLDETTRAEHSRRSC